MLLWFPGVLLLVLVSPTPTPNSNPTGLRTAQLVALREMYDATSGKRWKYTAITHGAKWSFASSQAAQSDPCLSRWAGVRCDSKNSSVIALDVNSMGLDGKLTEKIGALTALTYFDASDNSLSGTLPAGLFLLTRLRFCQIDSNRLEGTLPADIGQLKALTYLSLYDNKLRGTLSPAVGQLKLLNELHLSFNSLFGSLPDALFGLTSLSALSLKSNKFQGTLSPAVGQLKVLTLLDLQSNSLSGSLPYELFELTALKALSFFSNKFEGTLSPTIGEVKGLSRLDLSFNTFSGTFPVELFDLTGLQSLSLEFNKFEGELCPAIGQLKILTLLDIHSNSLSGSLPSELFELTALSALSLESNRFNGTLSPAVGQLKVLTMLDLSVNSLSGSLPVEMFEITGLQALSLEFNNFAGTLSPTIGQLKVLTRLDLSVNSLFGTLPVEMFEITTLLALSLESNIFDGTLSSKVGQLKAINWIYLYSNNLSGSLPSELFEITTLKDLSLEANNFAGTLSPTVGQLKVLTRLDLSVNSLSGSFPSELFEITTLKDLSLEANNFAGTLSPTIGQLKVLTRLDLSVNKLFGTLPVEVFDLTGLQDLRLFSNNFEGTLSPTVGHLKVIVRFYLYSNKLSGSLPSELFHLTSLQDLSLYSNRLEGTLSPAVGQLKALTLLSLYANCLSGKLPVELFELTALSQLKLHNNIFSGSLPSMNVSRMIFLHISIFDVSNNALTGSPPLWLSAAPKLVNFSIANNSFSSSTLDFLPSANVINVDISGNFLGGTLPAKIFRDSPGLKRFVAASNCFSGTVPLAICKATSLETLILDGLSSGKRCTVPLFVPSGLFPHPGTKTLSVIQGGLPACLFSSLPNIATLHVSGNGLTGRAFHSAISRWPLFLDDLSLSHNRLTGPISAELQSGLGQFKNFDIANNLLDGMLSSVKLNDATKANFIVNRFSGPLSNTLVAASVVQVLEGNLIGCSSLNRNTQLPSKDPYLNRYSCGSNTFNVSFAVFAALISAFAVLATLWFRVSLSKLFKQLVGPAAAAAAAVGSDDDSISLFIGALQRISRICALLIATLVVVCIPTYAAVSSSYKTHSDLYSWSVSATFVGGVAPAVVFLVLWSILLFLWDWALLAQTWSKSSPKPQTSFGTISGLFFYVAALKKTAAQVAVFTFNAFFVLIANALYVVVVKTGSNLEQKMVSVALTLFKLLWNRFVLPYVVKQAERSSATAPSLSTPQGLFLKLEVLLAAFNIVVAPVIVLLTADSHCFGQAFSAPGPVTTSYDFVEGADYGNVQYDAKSESWIFRDIMATAYITYQPSFRYGYACSAALVTTYASVFVNMALFSCFAGPLWFVTVRSLIDREWLSNDFGARVLPTLIQTSQQRQIRREKQGDRGRLSYNIVDTHKIFLEVLQDLLALHTFGLVAPMCGLTIAVAIMVKMLKFRYALENFRSTQPAEDVEALTADCRTFLQHTHPFVEAHPLILLLSSVFLSAFLIDIAGDAVGWKDALWVS